MVWAGRLKVTSPQDNHDNKYRQCFMWAVSDRIIMVSHNIGSKLSQLFTGENKDSHL